jgi:hypothetical protein
MAYSRPNVRRGKKKTGVRRAKRMPLSDTKIRYRSIRDGKPISSPREDSLPRRKTNKLARRGWRYNARRNAWLPPRTRTDYR